MSWPGLLAQPRAEAQVGLPTQTLLTPQLCSIHWGSVLNSNTHHRQQLTLHESQPSLPSRRSPGEEVLSPLAGSQPTYYLFKHLASGSLNKIKDRKFSLRG